MHAYTITETEAGQRFLKYLKKLLPQASSGFFYKNLRKKNIVLNGKKSDGKETLQIGDEVRLYLAEETIVSFSAEEELLREFEALKNLPEGKIPVIYEDADIIVLNKPRGMLSQKAGASDISANEYLLSYLIHTGYLTPELLKTFRPAVCNRLDRNTSGLILAGKTVKGLQEMSNALKNHTVQKYYLCIVKGELTSCAHMRGFLEKDETTNTVTVFKLQKQKDAKEIETEYEPVNIKNGYTLLKVHLLTGRSHQIRAHLSQIGHPVIGDPKYGDQNVNRLFYENLRLSVQLLHACQLEFANGRVITAPPDHMFEKAWKFIEENRI